MTATPPEKTDLELALDTLTTAVEGWDPDVAPSVEPMLGALRELHLLFDPRKERLSASLCMTSLMLLEQIHESGVVQRDKAIGAVGELTHGLRESLIDLPERLHAKRAGARHEMITLETKSSGGGLSLALDSVEHQTMDDLMVKMGMLTREQADRVREVRAEKPNETTVEEIALELGYVSAATIESAQRLMARGSGAVPPPKEDGDPWGNSPL